MKSKKDKKKKKPKREPVPKKYLIIAPDDDIDNIYGSTRKQDEEKTDS